MCPDDFIADIEGRIMFGDDVMDVYYGIREVQADPYFLY
jgi:hypothetical protein